MCQENSIIELIKVVASIQDATINNALTFQSGVFQFGGPLVKNTEVSGAFRLDLGITSSRLTEFNVRTSGRVFLEFNNGIGTSTLTLDSNGVLVTDTNAAPKGLFGSANFSANYIANSYIQKVYADSRIAGKQITAILANPTVTQNGYFVTWNNSLNQFDLTIGVLSAGTDTQVIYNSGGSLTGDNNFVYSSNTLSVGNINLGVNTLAGALRTIQVLSSSANSALDILTKGIGDLRLGIESGSIIIGKTTSTSSSYKVVVNGTQPQIDIYIEPKGTEGVVYVGSSTDAGGYRYIRANGSAGNVSLVLQSKLESNSVIIGSRDLRLGLPTTTTVERSIIAEGSEPNINLSIWGKGLSFLKIGNPNEASTGRFLEPTSSSATCDLFITGKNLGINGRVWINGRTTVEIPIPSWNMDSTSNISIAFASYGLTASQILDAQAIIRNDAGTLYSNLLFRNGVDNTIAGWIEWSTTDFILNRRLSGPYDAATYSGTGFNRGTLLVTYKP